MKAVVFLLSLLIIFASSEARPIEPLPQPHRSFKVNATQNDRSCSYTVDIRTSCSSTRYTRDQISLAFGDAYGNQVYAPRSGYDGWKPESVTVYGYYTRSISFYYNTWIPDDIWSLPRPIASCLSGKIRVISSGKLALLYL
ncbi:Embryo-specific protein ATS3B [Citrus sinensis]|uniref:Embryo-specific protein ATS3B n=1 Tax=Citrus sinensis TaxID=2711 RepID=A0ACB8JBS5_CITSI|nr:Embryo-specific protein ATS3B [Citrus sinensis]